MKKILLMLATAFVLTLAGCDEMGIDGSIIERIEDLEERVSEVETLVNADQNGLVITSVQEVAEGYLITFSDGSSITVKHGKDGADGKDGQDGEDGKDGQDGENGSAGENGSNGSCIITSVEIGADSVTFNLSDGRTVVIPLQEGAVTPNAPTLSISFDYSHIDVVMPGQEYIIPYTVESNYDDITVEAFSANSYLLIATAIPDAEDNKKGTIHFVVIEGMGGYEMPSELEQELLLNSKITVLATDGKSVVMRTLKFENGVIGTYDASDIIVSGDGEVVQLNFLTNVEYTVEFESYYDGENVADWLSLVETKALEEKTINVKVEKNDTGRCRRAYVNIYSQPYDTMWGDDERIGFSYEIYQNGTGEIEVNEITWTVGYEGGYFYGYELPFELVSYGNYMYCEESCSWIDYYFYRYDGEFEHISVDYNDTIEERTATITIQEEFYEYVYVYNEEYDYGYIEEQGGNYKTTNIINVVQSAPELETVEVTAVAVSCNYYGDMFGGPGYNYFLALSDKGFDEDGYVMRNSRNYVLDLYSDTPAADGNYSLPLGTYTFDKLDTMEPGTMGTYGYALMCGAAEDGSEDEEHLYTAGTVVISENKIEATLILNNGEVHHIVYEGSLAFSNATEEVTGWSQLLGDMDVTSAEGYYVIEPYGDYYEVGADNYFIYIYQGMNMETGEPTGVFFNLDILASGLNTTDCLGTYTPFVGEDIFNTFIPGSLLEEDGEVFPVGCIAMDMESQGVGPVFGGTIKIETGEAGKLNFTFDCVDDCGNAITGVIEAADMYGTASMVAPAKAAKKTAPTTRTKLFSKRNVQKIVRR